MIPIIVIVAAVLDQEMVALPVDVSTKASLNQTLVVLGTEFGRTPWVNDSDGRDHHDKAVVAPSTASADAGLGVKTVNRKFGQRVRQLRLEPGWSQEELGHRAGKHWTYIGGIEPRPRFGPLRRDPVSVAAALYAGRARSG